MSVMEKLFGAFGGQPAPQPAPQPQPGNIPAGSGATNPANSTVPEGGGAAPEAAASPLAEFAELWKPAEGANQPTEMFGNVDPKKLMEAASKTNFAQAIPKEVMQKIANGGQDAMEAFAVAMNTVSQQVYANSALATTKIVEQALKKAQETYDARLPGIIKQHTVSDALRSDNPIFSNPAVAPIISALEQQLTQKFPSATATEITDMAKIS